MAKLRKEDFGSVNFATPTSDYVAPRLDAVSAAAQAHEQAAQKNIGEYRKLDTALSNISGLRQDTELLEAEKQKLRTGLDEIRQSGNYALATPRVTQLASDFAKSDALRMIQANKAAAQAHEKSIMADKTLTADQKMAAIQLSRERYSGVRRIDPATGEVTTDPSGILTGQYEGFTPGQTVDVADKINKFGAGYKADVLQRKGVKFDGTGRIIMSSLAESGVSEATIRQDLQQSITNDDKAMNSLEQEFLLDAIRTNPEYFENGQLTAEGEAAKTETINNKINNLVDSAASKYGFERRSISVDVKADQAALKNKQAKLEAAVTQSTDRTTITPSKHFESKNYSSYIAQSKKQIKALENKRKQALATQDGTWLPEDAGELRRLKQIQLQKQVQYNMFKAQTMKTPDGIKFKKDLANRFGVKPDSHEVDEFLSGNFDPLVNTLTSSKVTSYADLHNQSSTSQAGLQFIDAFTAWKQMYENLIDENVKGKDISFDADAVNIRDAKGKDIISENLTDQVNTNGAAFLIDDGSGNEIPLDQYRSEHELYEGYNMKVRPLASRIGGRHGYSLTFTPKAGSVKDGSDSANEREALNLILYPGKGAAKTEQHTNETIMTKALESAGVRTKDDRSKVNYGLDANRLNTSTENKDLYKIGQNREADRIFADGFSGVEVITQEKGGLPVGKYTFDTHGITVPGLDGKPKKANLVIKQSASGHNTYELVNDKGVKLHDGKNITSLKDLYVDLLKTRYNLLNPKK